MLNTTTYIYDSQGNLSEIREPLGRTTKFEYDTIGRKTREIDPNGNVTTFDYDNNDNLTKVTNVALNKYVQFEYDENNNRKAVIDEDLNRTTYTYDTLNRLESVIDPEGGTTIYGYDSINRVISKKVKVDAVIWKTTSYNYAYVGNELHVTETDSDNKTFKYIYDANGNLTSIIYPNEAGTSNTISMTYDALNRIKTRKEPLTNPTWYKSSRRRTLSYRTQYAGLGGIFVAMMVWNFIATHSLSKAAAEFARAELKSATAESAAQEFAEIKGEAAHLQEKARTIEEIDSKIDVANILAEIEAFWLIKR